MKIVILGIDGYIGWALALDLLEGGYEVAGLDNFSRRTRVERLGSDSLTPIAGHLVRHDILRNYKNYIDERAHFNISYHPEQIDKYMEVVKPDVVVHLAEQPSAPWSMISADKAALTQQENVIGTLYLLWAMKRHCPDAHLVKLGTMGEYGTPNVDIPEGEIEEFCPQENPVGDSTSHNDCPMHGLPFPRSPFSFYHLSKVHDTHNIIFACKNWGLRSTDIMQGVVFGLADTTEGRVTRLDYDEYFGTVINRFMAQAIRGIPLTVYGKGEQKRGFLPLLDSIQCLNLAIENPPEIGEYRTLNQFENVYTINGLADRVVSICHDVGIKIGIQHIDNPRVELEDHYYNPSHQKLFDLGYEPVDMDYEIYRTLSYLTTESNPIIKDVIMPKTTWK